MQPLTLNQAAKACSKSKSTILEAIRSGRLSAGRDDKNQWQIEPSELFRVYPTEHLPLEQNRCQPVGIPQQNYSTNLLFEQIERERDRERRQFQETIDDLRHRLDQEAEERRRLTLLLTDQREKPDSKRVKSLLWEKLFGRSNPYT